MFRALSCSSLRATTSAVGASSFTVGESGGSRAVGRGRADPTMTNNIAITNLRRKKTEAATAVFKPLMIGMMTPENVELYLNDK
jgi:hypothetical protein